MNDPIQQVMPRNWHGQAQGLTVHGQLPDDSSSNGRTSHDRSVRSSCRPPELYRHVTLDSKTAKSWRGGGHVGPRKRKATPTHTPSWPLCLPPTCLERLLPSTAITETHPPILPSTKLDRASTSDSSSLSPVPNKKQMQEISEKST